MINFFKFAKQILKPIFMKLTKKDVMTKPEILHYTPQSNKALCCRFCLILAFMLGLCTISFGLSGNLVGISINLCKSIQKELFINDTP